MAVGLLVAGAFAAAAAPAGASAPQVKVSYPTGAYAHRQPLGWVELIHGGGWALPPDAMGFENPMQDRFNSWGWATLNVGYRPGRMSLVDSLSLYDRLRRRVPAVLPVCVEGGSAGGQLALMVAVRRHNVACVLAMAAPTDFVHPNRLTPLAREAFGHDLRRFSPALLPFSAPAIAACARNDPVVPCGQVERLARTHRNVRPVYLDPGSSFFQHTDVAGGELSRLWAQSRRFLVRTARRWRYRGAARP